MIRFENISKIYNSHSIALKSVTFEVKPNEFVSVVGRSGAGKSTLLKLLIAEEKPTGGKIFFDKQNILQMRPDELPFLRRQIGAVFQDFKLLPNKTAYENVAFAMEVAGKSEREIKERRATRIALSRSSFLPQVSIMSLAIDHLFIKNLRQEFSKSARSLAPPIKLT